MPFSSDELVYREIGVTSPQASQQFDRFEDVANTAVHCDVSGALYESARDAAIY